jgi:hypothetical protein
VWYYSLVPSIPMCCYDHEVAALIPTGARLTFQLAGCGYTIRVTSQTLHSPEYITSKCTQKRIIWHWNDIDSYAAPTIYAKPNSTFYEIC